MAIEKETPILAKVLDNYMIDLSSITYENEAWTYSKSSMVIVNKVKYKTKNILGDYRNLLEF